ncbi:MAG: hypothetical protein AAGK01_06345 [Pseudomonadota bacterium]
MNEGQNARFSIAEIAPILTVLEQQLASLDRIGATIAAAHLDAAIQQLRIDQARSTGAPTI